MKRILLHHTALKVYSLMLVLLALCAALWWLIVGSMEYATNGPSSMSPIKVAEVKNKPKGDLPRDDSPVSNTTDLPTTKPEAPPVASIQVDDYKIPAASQGRVPVVYRIPTSKPVVFLTIDDGVYKDQSVIDTLEKNSIKASFFLTDVDIAGRTDFFKPLVSNGYYVENHTISHDIHMSQKSYEYQKSEICGMSDKVTSYYGRRPIFFRPPGGAYSDTMLRAAYDCDIRAVVTWIAKVNGGSLQYQVGNGLRAGDIVLMHFRPEFQQDLDAFMAAAKAAGLQTALLEDLQFE